MTSEDVTLESVIKLLLGHGVNASPKGAVYPWMREHFLSILYFCRREVDRLNLYLR